MSNHDDLQSKIARAKRQLPLPQLLSTLNLSEHAKRSARCPFAGHEDKNPSFSVFEGTDGFWHWKCHAGCGEGDEITFISKLKDVSRGEAMSQYLELAGFPRSCPPVSREYPASLCNCVSAFPVSPASPEYPASLVSPVSEGQAAQGDIEQELKMLATRNACTARKGAKRRRFKLAQDLAAVEKRIGGQLALKQLRIAAYEWYRLSEPSLNAEDSREDHLAALIAEVGKVLFPTGENRLMIAIEKVSQLPIVDLPMIPECPNAPEEWRRIAALHREWWLISGGKQYFLSYRDAAKVVAGLCHQKAHNITLALKRFGVIEIVNKGQAGSNGKAAEFLYLLPESEHGTWEDSGLEL